MSNLAIEIAAPDLASSPELVSAAQAAPASPAADTISAGTYYDTGIAERRAARGLRSVARAVINQMGLNKMSPASPSAAAPSAVLSAVHTAAGAPTFSTRQILGKRRVEEEEEEKEDGPRKRRHIVEDENDEDRVGQEIVPPSSLVAASASASSTPGRLSTAVASAGSVSLGSPVTPAHRILGKRPAATDDDTICFPGERKRTSPLSPKIFPIDPKVFQGLLKAWVNPNTTPTPTIVVSPANTAVGSAPSSAASAGTLVELYAGVPGPRAPLKPSAMPEDASPSVTRPPAPAPASFAVFEDETAESASGSPLGTSSGPDASSFDIFKDEALDSPAGSPSGAAAPSFAIFEGETAGSTSGSPVVSAAGSVAASDASSSTIFEDERVASAAAFAPGAPGASAASSLTNFEDERNAPAGTIAPSTPIRRPWGSAIAPMVEPLIVIPATVVTLIPEIATGMMEEMHWRRVLAKRINLDPETPKGWSRVNTRSLPSQLRHNYGVYRGVCSTLDQLGRQVKAAAGNMDWELFFDQLDERLVVEGWNEQTRHYWEV